jgi:hypothetical protein
LWSEDKRKTWNRFPFKWSKGIGQFEPRRFLHAGKGYSDAEDEYVYIYGRKFKDPQNYYLARVHRTEIKSQKACQFY